MCADACVLVPATWATAKPTPAIAGTVCASSPNRYAKPMGLPLNLEAVYLEEFKRALAWASCRRPAWEFWQGIGSSPKKYLRKPFEFGSMSQLGALAEWLRSGLQSRLHRFDSGGRL
jgi:hypothetical protein